MVILLILGIVIVVVFSLFFLFKFLGHNKNMRYLLSQFESCNVITFGKKRTGKDLVHQYVINKRDMGYYSNISYGGDYHKVKINDMSVAPNTYENFINGNVVKIKRKFKEAHDIYLSDTGIILPSHMDNYLDKKYPSFPIFYALSGQLYDLNVHINTQALIRPWKKLREQGDFFVHVLGTRVLFGFLFLTEVYTYEKYMSAEKEMLPLSKRLFNKTSSALSDQYYATYGEIKHMTIIQFKHNIVYDTRAFEKMLLKGKRKY